MSRHHAQTALLHALEAQAGDGQDAPCIRLSVAASAALRAWWRVSPAGALGRKIRELRHGAQLSQGDLAKRLGISQGQLCRYELGDGPLPDVGIFGRLLDVFQLDPKGETAYELIDLARADRAARSGLTATDRQKVI